MTKIILASEVFHADRHALAEAKAAGVQMVSGCCSFCGKDSDALKTYLSNEDSLGAWCDVDCFTGSQEQAGVAR